MLITIVIVGLIALDQITKYLVRQSMAVGETLPVIQDVLHLTYVRNRGAAFSMFQDQHLVTIAFPLLATIICLAIMIYMYRRGDKFAAYTVALIFVGGVGNLIDRIQLGYVTDMIDFRIFPVFNVADICVTCGCALLMVYVIFQDKFDARLKGSADSADTTGSRKASSNAKSNAKFNGKRKKNRKRNKLN